jgi:membrane protein YqaA with SNARE-associated domain
MDGPEGWIRRPGRDVYGVLEGAGGDHALPAMQTAPRRRPDTGNMTFDALWPLLVMLVSAFGAATLLVLPSEAVLAAQIKAGLAPVWALLVVATIGNVGGSVFNWWLGRHALRFQDRHWFPFTPTTIDSASTRFQRWGLWSLLFAWVPIIGDPLTFIAGVLRIPFHWFLPLVAIGKGGRYAILAAGL